MLFNCFISHRYLPRDFMTTAIVPIIKNKIEDSSHKNNYRPIALVTACSKKSIFYAKIAVSQFFFSKTHFEILFRPFIFMVIIMSQVLINV